MEFHIGREDNGNQFRYAKCSCHCCNVFKHNRCIIRGNSEQKKGAYIMSDAQIHITCPRCNYSNTTSMPIGKYDEVVYQLATLKKITTWKIRLHVRIVTMVLISIGVPGIPRLRTIQVQRINITNIWLARLSCN